MRMKILTLSLKVKTKSRFSFTGPPSYTCNVIFSFVKYLITENEAVALSLAKKLLCTINECSEGLRLANKVIVQSVASFCLLTRGDRRGTCSDLDSQNKITQMC